MTTALRWLPLVAAALQLVGTALLVWGLKVGSNPSTITFYNEEGQAFPAAGIMREHEWAITWGVRLLLLGLALAVVTSAAPVVQAFRS